MAPNRPTYTNLIFIPVLFNKGFLKCSSASNVGELLIFESHQDGFTWMSFEKILAYIQHFSEIDTLIDMLVVDATFVVHMTTSDVKRTNSWFR